MLNDFMKKLFGKNGGSKETAKRRLQFALVYDRLEVSDEILKKMQNELVNVISRYFVIDHDQLKLDITRHDDMSALVFNTPIISAKARQIQQQKQQQKRPKGKGARKR